LVVRREYGGQYRLAITIRPAFAELVWVMRLSSVGPRVRTLVDPNDRDPPRYIQSALRIPQALRAPESAGHCPKAQKKLAPLAASLLCKVRRLIPLVAASRSTDSDPSSSIASIKNLTVLS
jgi:hypothetical protein